jgi:hypothetical protein
VTGRRRGIALRSLLGAAAVAMACARPDAAAEGAGAEGTGNEPGERTVFNDSSLFRELCLEADSGLTISAGRCTPRHQGNPIQ